MNVHFIAIGGSAMHNLARALDEKGEQVAGSDDAILNPPDLVCKKKDCCRKRKAGFLIKSQLRWM